MTLGPAEPKLGLAIHCPYIYLQTIREKVRYDEVTGAKQTYTTFLESFLFLISVITGINAELIALDTNIVDDALMPAVLPAVEIGFLITKNPHSKVRGE